MGDKFAAPLVPSTATTAAAVPAQSVIKGTAPTMKMAEAAVASHRAVTTSSSTADLTAASRAPKSSNTGSSSLRGGAVTFGRFRVTAAPRSPQCHPQQGQRSLAASAASGPSRLGDGRLMASPESSSPMAAAAMPAPRAVSPSSQAAPSESCAPSEASIAAVSASGRIVRQGRFTVLPSEGPENAAPDDATSSVSPFRSTSTDSASVSTEKMDSRTMNLQDVHSFLEVKHQQLGALFDNLRMEIAQIISGSGGMDNNLAASLAQMATRSPALQTPAASSSTHSATNSVVQGRQSSLRPRTVRSGSKGSTASGGGGKLQQPAAPLGSPPVPTRYHGVDAGSGMDEAINMWEALGKPVFAPPSETKSLRRRTRDSREK